MSINNNFNFIGRLARDPERKQTSWTGTICTIALAVERREDKGADFFHITVFGKQAEAMLKYKKKGDLIAVSGHISNDSYVGRDGTKKWAISFAATQIEYLGKRTRNIQEDTPEAQVTEKLAERDLAFRSSTEEECPF